MKTLNQELLNNLYYSPHCDFFGFFKTSGQDYNIKPKRYIVARDKNLVTFFFELDPAVKGWLYSVEFSQIVDGKSIPFASIEPYAEYNGRSEMVLQIQCLSKSSLL